MQNEFVFISLSGNICSHIWILTSLNHQDSGVTFGKRLLSESLSFNKETARWLMFAIIMLSILVPGRVLLLYLCFPFFENVMAMVNFFNSYLLLCIL